MRALVIGQGSAGMRHARLLSDMGLDVQVVSARPTDAYPRHEALDEGLRAAHWDYVVVASPTADHHAHLSAILESGLRCPVLVEKPLFHETLSLPKTMDNSRVYVGYNLRLHPAFVRFQELLQGLELYSLSIRTGQHLGQWRPGRDVRSTYSADTAGGGVLRDLSHELDYAALVAGPLRSVAAVGGSFSDLDIESDDVFFLLAEAERCPAVSICLDYLDREGRREVVANAAGTTVSLDLVRNTVTHDGNSEAFDVDRDATYILQHRDILEHGGSRCCSWSQGMATLRAIDAARRAAANRQWENV